ncbi:hypothetical protein [Streptomyces albidochromogenes]|nr:hypothetical protein [Streptomyces albidochromogenes]
MVRIADLVAQEESMSELIVSGYDDRPAADEACDCGSAAAEQPH